MPVHKINGGYQYGTTGKKYYGKDAKTKAKRQALAIRLNGYKEEGAYSKLKKHEKAPSKTSRELGHTFVYNFFRKENQND